MNETDRENTVCIAAQTWKETLECFESTHKDGINIAFVSGEQGRRSRGRVEGAVKQLRAIQAYKKTKKSLPMTLVSVQQRWWPHKNTRNYKNKHTEVCRCTKSCNKFVQFHLDKAWNYLWHFYEKAPPLLLPPHPLCKGRGTMPLSCTRSPASLLDNVAVLNQTCTTACNLSIFLF